MPDSAPGPLVQLDLTASHRHLVGVRLVFTPARATPTLRLPGWTPGSYLIRDYVRTLEGLSASQGESSRPFLRKGPASWQLVLDSLDAVEVRYSIMATELSVRTCHLNADHAFLALAGVVLQVEGERWSPHRLELRLPQTWQPFLPLPPDGERGWRARDYDQLIDSPLEAGPHPSHDFTVAGVPHRWVTWGGDLPASDASWLVDVERVCLACCRLMGEETPPSPEPYLFVLHLLEEGYGGLEHDQAAVLQYGRRALARGEGRRKLLQLVAHEYLHQWNVRRLRPAELTPIDYEQPVIVPSLWFAEGVTSYVDQLLPLAAGIGAETDLLDDLGADLSRYLLTPGRRVQSLRLSSQEAWVKLYRPDAYAADSQISYYLKGAVLALVLDLHLRRHGAALCRVLQELWRSHGRWGRGYREEDLIGAFADHAVDLSTLLPKWLASTEDPPLEDYLEDVGLRLVSECSSQPFMGWQFESNSQAGLKLKRIHRDGPAEQAGLQVGDELLALDHQRLRLVEDLGLLLSADRASSSLELLFCRDGRVRTAVVMPAAPAIERWRLQIDPAAAPGAAQRRAWWLSLQP